MKFMGVQYRRKPWEKSRLKLNMSSKERRRKQKHELAFGVGLAYSKPCETSLLGKK